jgi:arylsulfatase A-like enzyme
MVSIDTLRADRLHRIRLDAQLMPNLKALAAAGVAFEWAITPSPSTRKATWSILSGRHVSNLALAGKYGDQLAPGGQVLLAEPFSQAGYDTAAVLSFARGFTRSEGAVAGFDSVDFGAVPQQQQHHHSADVVADTAIAWLEQRRESDPPFLLWLHMADPHFPYVDIPGAPVFGPHSLDRYDSNVRHTDNALGRVLSGLDQTGQRHRTVVVVFGDHGEEFLEHGQHFHGKTLYDEVVRVPWVIQVPDMGSRVVADPVSLVDLMPTLLELAGLPPVAGIDGVSLVPVMRDSQAPTRTVLSQPPPTDTFAPTCTPSGTTAPS